jgi:hypothetical protein
MSTPDRDEPDRKPSDERNDVDHAASRPGSGKQFAKEVHSPDDEPRKKGSGKQFEPADSDDETATEESKGSGKQFSPGHHDQ